MKIPIVNNNINNIYFAAKKRGQKTGGCGNEDTLKVQHEKEDKRYFNYSGYLARFVSSINKRVHSSIKVETPPKPFIETHGKYILDKYQKEAIESFNSGKTTIVSAPTGTGKTLIAEHVIDKTLKEGKKIIYLSPLKALSNEKYSDFAKLFGKYDERGNLISTENVGLLTGDTSINPNAPVLVMTTEIYRNSLLTNSEDEVNKKYKDYTGVIYDEFHYLSDKDRGTVWEEAIINTPKHMKQLMLSATASNTPDILKWVKSTNSEIDTHLVIVPESERHVPLRELVLTCTNGGNLKFEPIKKQKISIYQIKDRTGLSERQLRALDEIKNKFNLQDDDSVYTFIRNITGTDKDIKSEVLSERLIESGMDKDRADAISLVLSKKNLTEYKRNFQNEFPENPNIIRVVKELDNKKMTPALIYIFSKRKCEDELQNAAENGRSLLTEEESQMVFEEVQKAKKNGIFLGADFDDVAYVALTKGYATHHAGKLPAYKSLIEKLAQKGLIKACFATETLIAGINMPFKTTVFTSSKKEVEDGVISNISTQTYKQGAGRAGRRGKDLIGNVVIMPKSSSEYNTYVGLSSSLDTSIKSNYRLSFATLLSDRMLNKRSENISRTLAVYQNADNAEALENEANNKLEFLEKLGYVIKKGKNLYERTEKGDLAKRVFGIDEVFLVELLSNPKYLKGFTDIELTALCASYADVKDVEPKETFDNEYSYLNNRMSTIFNLSKRIDAQEEGYGADNKPIKFSTSLVPYVLEFAKGESDREKSIENWQNIMVSAKGNRLIAHEGDFLRIVNQTVTLLRLIAELSEDDSIKEEAKKAISKLKKAPVTDIFNYELADSAMKSNSEYEF